MNATDSNLNENVLPLFAKILLEKTDECCDPLQDLLNEAQAEAWSIKEEQPVPRAERILVTANQFPDQSLFVLEKQLSQFNETMGRLKFYLSDLDDLLPR